MIGGARETSRSCFLNQHQPYGPQLRVVVVVTLWRALIMFRIYPSLGDVVNRWIRPCVDGEVPGQPCIGISTSVLSASVGVSAGSLR